MDKVDLTRLLQESRQLNVRIRSTGHDSVLLPELVRGLDQIQEMSSQLMAKLSRPAGELSDHDERGGINTSKPNTMGVVTPAQDPALRERAALFLASRGFDLVELEEVVRKAASVLPQAELAFTATADGTKRIEPIFEGIGSGGPIDRDLERFLNNERETIINRVLLAAQDRRNHQLLQWREKKHQEKWKEFKRISLEPHLEAKLKGISSIGRDSLTKSTATPKAQAYTRVIKTFNETRLKKISGASGMGSIELIRSFMQEIKSTRVQEDDLKVEMLLDAWRMLKSLLTSVSSQGSLGDYEADGPDGGLENVFQAAASDFSTAYMAGLDVPAGAPWKRQLVAGGKRFLEELYMRFVDRTLAQFPRDALLGGRPSRVERIRAFCELRLKRYTPAELLQVEMMLVGPSVMSGASGMMGGAIPGWMIIFYLVRCGLVKEAWTWVQEHEVVIQRSDPQFIAFFKAFVAGDNYRETIQGQIRSEYSQLLANNMTGSSQYATQLTRAADMKITSTTTGRTIDPFRMALYKIMGRCELARKSISGGLVIQSSEDWVWLQYLLIEDVMPEVRSSTLVTYSLLDLQRLVLDYGPSHFDPNHTNPWHYYTILSLVGLFEKGLEYLYQTGQTVDIIYFATVLVNAGCLRLLQTGEIGDVPFTLNQQSLEVSINYGALLYRYGQQQRQEQPREMEEALNTILLITLPCSPRYSPAVAGAYRKMALTALRDLVLGSGGELGSLLGDVGPDGTVRPGRLVQYGRLLGLKSGEGGVDERTGNINNDDINDGFLQELTVAAADQCHREGKFRQSLQLYNLAHNYDRVIEILCGQLGGTFLRPYDPVMIEDLRQTAQSILNYYASQPRIANSLNGQLRATCTMLLTVTEIRKLAEEGDWRMAVESLHLLAEGGLLPPFPNPQSVLDQFASSGIGMGAMRAAAERAQNLPSSLANIFPETLLLSMQVIAKRVEELRGYIGIDNVSMGGRAQEVDRLKKMARTLMTFIGLLKVRVPQEIFVQMTRLEVAL